MDSLQELIEKIKQNLSSKDEVYPNEASVRELIVMPIIRDLGWDTTDPTAIRPEYHVKKSQSESRKVDYALFARKHSNAPGLIIEVKAVGKVDADDQLFEYAFMTGVPIAILTDGKEWRVYLPMTHGSIQERLIRTIDLLNNNVEEITEALQQFLSFANTQSGRSVEIADNISKQKKNRELAKSKIGDAWANLTNSPEAKIVEMIVQETSRICGTPPDRHDVIEFLGQITSAPPIVIPGPSPGRPRKRKITYWLFDEEKSASSYANAYKEIMDNLVPRIAQNKLNEINFVYSRKTDITTSVRKAAFRLSNGMYIHTNTNSKTKIEQLKVVCIASSIRFGDKSGLLLPT